MIQSSQLLSLCRPLEQVGTLPSSFKNLQDDSRKIQQGDVFIAVRGVSSDGHAFIGQAITQGAVLVICEEKQIECSIPQLIVRSTSALLFPLALAFQNHPEKEMTCIGVTGTNGKTTISTLLYQLLMDLGVTTGLIGTVAKRIGHEVVSSKLTTPGAIELASDFREMADAGCSHVIMEVSSHALKQERVQSSIFSVAVFTNLTHDHLDYHPTMEDYALSKQRLFNDLHKQAFAIVNFDDPYGEVMVRSTSAKVIGVRFGKGGNAKILHSDAEGQTLEVEKSVFKTPLVGTFNAYNVAQAFLACLSLGFKREDVLPLLEKHTGANGRLEKVYLSDAPVELPSVFVDYAHTPDALKNVAETLKEVVHENARFIIVFGCGGDRDKGKRSVMAQIAVTYADQLYITSDNPRFEHPEAIINDVVQGLSEQAQFHKVTDRREAILQSITSAGNKDTILIAGKGHETYQEIKGVRYPMDDRAIARDALKERLTNYVLKGGDK